MSYAKRKQWAIENKRCVGCTGPYEGSRLYCQACRDRQTSYHTKAREQVLNHYGPICKCCGETTPEFLTIDHINNDGAERRAKDSTECRLAQWVVKNGFPTDLQILCFNCNMAKRHGKVCPHQKLKS